MKYTTSFRNSVLKKIHPPSNRSVTSVSKKTGVAVVTINNWLAKLKEGKMSLDEDDEKPSSMRKKDSKKIKNSKNAGEFTKSSAVLNTRT